MGLHPLDLTRSMSRWAKGGVRQLAVVEDLVLEVGELLDDLLALGLLLHVVGLGNGTVDVVNGASLLQSEVILSKAEKVLTRMTGQRLRTESLAKDVGSEVTDWPGSSVSNGWVVQRTSGASRVLVSYSILAIKSNSRAEAVVITMSRSPRASQESWRGIEGHFCDKRLRGILR